LALLSIPSVVDAQAERYAQLLPQFADMSEQLETFPLSAIYSEEGTDGRELRVLTVGATGTSPVDLPTWLPKLPEPGEVIVSPALRDLIDAGNRVILDRFPQTVVAEIGQEALVAPDELAAVVGAPVEDFDQRVGYVGFGRTSDERGDVDPRAIRLVVAVVVLFVLAPLVVLIATASRLSARTTERRLAALRVLGLSAKRARRVLAAETSVVAMTGALGGAAVWAIARPFSQRVGVGSLNWWASDVSVPPLIVGFVIAVVVALTAVIALVGANPTVESPGQGRANRAAPPTRRWRPVVLATGLLLLASSYVFTTPLPDNIWFAIFALGNLLTALGLAVSVPTFARLAADILDRKQNSTAATLSTCRSGATSAPLASVSVPSFGAVEAGRLHREREHRRVEATQECRLVRRFYDDAWNRWDDDAVDTLLAEGFEFRGSLADEMRRPTAWRSYRDSVRRAVPDFHNEIVDLVTALGRAAVRLLYTGHHHGELLGIRGHGLPIAYGGAAFFHCVEWQLMSAWVLGDLDSLREQLHP